MRKALTAVAVVALLGMAVFAAPASATVTITTTANESSVPNVMYADFKPGWDHNAVYLAFTATSDTAYGHAWMKLIDHGGNIQNVGTGVHELRELVSVASDGTPTFTYGLDAMGTPQTGFFLVKASALDDVGQTLTVKVYSDAALTNEIGTQDFTFYVGDSQFAMANKPQTTVTLPAVPEVGKVGTVTVTGETGTVGSNLRLYFTPQVFDTWPADTFEYVHTSIDIAGFAHTPYHDTLLIPPADVLTTNNFYTAEYVFVIEGPAQATVSPIAYVDSGQKMKYVPAEVGTFEVIICEPFTFDPASATLTPGTTDLPYTANGTITGGTAPYTINVTWNSPSSQPAWISSFTTNGSTDPATWSLSGTPPSGSGGTYQFTLDVTDANGCPGSMTYSFLIAQGGCPTITISSTPSPLPEATAGTLYGPVTFTASGSTHTPYHNWMVTPDPPAPGLTFNAATQTLSGTPTLSGSFPFTVSTQDSRADPFDCPGSQPFILVVNCPELHLVVDPPGLPDGQVGVAYTSGVFHVTGAVGAVTYSFKTNGVMGTLPPGLSFNTTTHVIEGTPSLSGAFSIEVSAVDSAGCSPPPVTFGIYICPVVTITTSSTLPAGIAGAAYSTALAVTPAGTYSWSSSDLPGWLSLNSGTGQLTGTPTVTGTYNFHVTVTDAHSCGTTKPFSIVVGCPAISVLPTSVPNGSINTAYPTQTFTASGGIPAHTFQISNENLPSGMSWNAGTKSIGGTPTQAGNFGFTITATDANGCQGHRDYTFSIAAPAPIPALGLAGLALLVLLLAGAAIFLLRRS